MLKDKNLIYYVKINGIYCNHCRETIKKKLLKNDNILDCNINGNIAKINVNKDIKNEIISTINNCGYETNEKLISKNFNKRNLYNIIILFSIVIILYLINLLFEKIFHFNLFNIIPTIDNSVSFLSIFFIGILTSLHCVGMCGAINLVASTSKKNAIIYNIGRISCYTLVGFIVGLIGNVFSFNQTILGIFTIFIAFLMFLMGLSMFGIFSFPKLKQVNFVYKKKNAFILGFLNGFIPCGPLSAMQLYAMSTSNPFKGTLSLFLFGLGTMPLMLGFGLIKNVFEKHKNLIQKLMSSFIVILSMFMIIRGFSILGINFTNYNNSLKDYKVATIEDNEQIIEIDLTYSHYEDIAIKKDIPVKFIINVDKNYLTGCNNEIISNDFNFDKKLKEGKNVINFTPTKEGIFTYTCWMNMIKNKIYVYN